MRRIAVGRIVGLVLAILGFGLSVRCSHDALRLSAEYHDSVNRRPMEASLDLSQAGETTVPFQQTTGMSHGEALLLSLGSGEESQADLEQLLKGLSGSLVIQDRDGNPIETARFNDKSAGFWDGQIMLAGIAPLRTGDYIATIRVAAGAPALAGTPQKLYVKYQLCGLELLPAFFAAAAAFAAGCIGLVAALCVLPGLLRGGVWRDSQNE